MKSNSTAELILLAAIWGASFLFMRVGSPEFGAVLFMALRTLIASLFLLPLMFAYKQQKALEGYYGKILFASMFNTAIPFVLFGYATLSLSAGVTSILNGTTPMFAAIVAYFWLRQKISLTSALGLLIGFVGVYVLMFDKLAEGQNAAILPTIAVLAAACCYGIGANFTKQYLGSIKPVALAAGSQVAASIVLVPISLAFLPDRTPSLEAIYSVILLGVVCTGIAYILFFRLIADLGAAKAVSVTYLIPAFGLLWGAIFLGEQITLWIILGSCLILLGVGLTTGVLTKALRKIFKVNSIAED